MYRSFVFNLDFEYESKFSKVLKGFCRYFNNKRLVHKDTCYIVFK